MNTMKVSDYIYFGDIADLMRGDQVVSDAPGSTIIFTMNTHRPFIPGNYTIHKYKENVVIFTHETTDVDKIHQYLLKTNVGVNFRAENYVNRYDWMEYRNWQCDLNLSKKFKKKLVKYLDHCFITTDNKFYTKDFDIVELEEKLYKAVDKDSGEVLAYISDIKRLGEWNYAAFLMDQQKQQSFAFIFQDEYTMREDFDEDLINFNGQVNMADFLKTD